MFKRYVAVFTSVFLFLAMFPFTFVQRVYAYQNNSYFNDLKIGLVSMSSTTITLTLGGEYTVNGQAFPSGTTLNLAVSGTSISFNGTVQNQISLTPSDKTSLITITSGSTSNKYMGSFIIKLLNGKLIPINYVDIETYLKGVVSYEMSDNFPLEALKTQAVAARNYALSRIGYESAKGYDFDDTINYQVYRGYNPLYKNSINAVEQTRGQVLLYNDKLVETLYSAWHGGASENSENVWGNTVPYLRSVQDSYESDPWPNGNRVLTTAQIQSTLISKGYLASTDTFSRLDLNSITKYPSGRVSNINIIYKNSSGLEQIKSVTKDNTRTFLSLPSNLYTVTYDLTAAAYTFSGKGNGHGLGMSQIGAKNRASAGQAYDQILKFYYTGTYLQNLILKASLSSLTQTVSSLYVGRIISFNTTAAGGNGYGYLYKYVIKNGSNIVLTKDYSSSSSLDFIPSSSGNYTVEAYVKDKFSISDFDDKKVSTFSAYDSLVLSSFSKDIENVFTGDTVNFNSSVAGGSGKGVNFKYIVLKDGQPLLTRDYSNISSFSYKPEAAGSYEVDVYALDSISSDKYDVSGSMTFNVKDRPYVNSISLDKSAYFVNDTATINAVGSASDSLYKFVVSRDGSIVFTRDYSTDSSVNYAPQISGSYQVQVFTKDSLSLADYDDVKSADFIVYDYSELSNIASDKAELFKNDTVHISASSTKGSGSYLYKFVVNKDNSNVLIQDYSSLNTLDFTPGIEGGYNITVYIRDALSHKDYDDMKNTNIIVYSQPGISLSSSQNSVLLGSSVNYSINEIDGSGRAQYRFIVTKDSSTVMDSGYTSSSSFSFNPVSAGTYQVTAYVKDLLSTNEFDDQSTLVLDVYNPQLSTVNASGYLYEGKSLSLNASGIGYSPAGFSYKYEIYSNGTLLASSSYSSSSAFAFTPSVAGSYTVKVYGKDGLSTNNYDSMKQFNLTINGKPLYLSILPLSYGMTNNDVTSLQNALIKLGYNLSGATGYFGTQTKSAVISFQSSRGLTADGVVGSMTYKALNDALIEKSGIKNLSF